MDRILEQIGEGAQRVQSAMEKAGSQFLADSAELGRTLLNRGGDAAGDMKHAGDALVQKIHGFIADLTGDSEQK